MAKRRPTEKTQSQQSASSKPTRQERRQATRNDARARQTVETASPLTAATSYSRQDVLALVALCLMVVVSYLPAMLWGGFVWDDNAYITEAELVREASGLWQIWFAPDKGVESHYWPLTYTTFWLEHKLWGFTPAGYHIVNVLLHLANTLLLWHLLRRLAVPGTWVTAAVFALHPLHVESVAWVIERKDVLSGLFYLAAALMWIRFVEQPRPSRYVGSLALYLAALLSKSIAVTLPAAFLIWHWWKQGRVTSADLFKLVPFFITGLAITIGDLSFYQPREGVSFDYSLVERSLIASRALWFYAAKLLWPTNLSVIYPRWDIHAADPLAWGYLVAAAALVVALWHFRSQFGRGPLAGALFFAVTLSPVLGFVDYGYMLYAFVADRFQYLASLGVMAVVIGAAAYGVRRLSDMWQKVMLGVVVVALVMLGRLTWQQQGVWRDNETLWSHVITLNPQARNAHRQLGLVLYKQGRYDEALDAYRVAAEQRPNYAKIHVNLGMVLNELGRYEEAETHLRRAIALNPQSENTHHRLGNVLYEQGRYEKALEATRIAVAQAPNSFEVHTNLGAILKALDRFEEAETHLRRAIALNPQVWDAYLNLGAALYEQGRYEEALEATRVAVEQHSDYSMAYANLGAILKALGRFEEVETHLRRAIALNPQNTDSFQQLIEVLTPQGRYEEAMDAIAQAAALAPDSTQAAKLHFLMGQTARENGQPEAAAEHYMHTLEADPHHAEALHWLATLRAQQQRYDEMLALLQRFIALYPNDAATYSNMGIALVFLGRNDEALQRFDQALSLDPTLENVRANREALLEAMKENVE